MNKNMSTKFVSKNANYMVVLKPGMEGNRALGVHAVPGIYVRFQSGVLDVPEKDSAIVEMLREHPSFGNDFVEIKEEDVDPYVDTRSDIEPEHMIQEIKYGHAEKMIGSAPKTKLTPQMRKLIENEALKMLPSLLEKNPDILKDMILKLASGMDKGDETPVAPVMKPAEAQKAPIITAPEPVEDESDFQDLPEEIDGEAPVEEVNGEKPVEKKKSKTSKK